MSAIRGLRGIGLVAVFVAAIALPGVARGDVDLSNDWVVQISGSISSFTCDLAFVQTGSNLTAGGQCRGIVALASFSGTVDPQSGAFSLSGGIVVLPPSPFTEIPISFSGAPSGIGVLSGPASINGFAGSAVARLCGNGNLDSGEACDDGTSFGGCCTPSCTPRPDGDSCSSTESCQIAPTCSAGVCVGAPKPPGTECEADGNRCTPDTCDGAGACAVGACSPCCGGPSCTPQPYGVACKVPTTSTSLIDIQSTPFGTKDKIVWSMPHVQATSIDDFPDPETTPYAVCFYTLDEDDDFDLLAHDVVAPTAQTCGRPGCWKKGAKSVSYNGGSLKPGGIASLRVNAGADGKAKVSFVGKGPALGLPYPFGIQIFGAEILVHLRAGDSCWSAQYLNLGNKPSILTSTRYRTRGGQ